MVSRQGQGRVCLARVADSISRVVLGNGMSDVTLRPTSCHVIRHAMQQVSPTCPSTTFWAEREWNESSKLDMRQWLCTEKPAEHKDRMKALGNIVVPHQAFLAMTVLTKMVAGQLS